VSSFRSGASSFRRSSAASRPPWNSWHLSPMVLPLSLPKSRSDCFYSQLFLRQNVKKNVEYRAIRTHRKSIKLLTKKKVYFFYSELDPVFFIFISFLFIIHRVKFNDLNNFLVFKLYNSLKKN